MVRALPSIGRTPTAIRVLARAGFLNPIRPDRLVGMGLAVRRYGVSMAAAYALQTARAPNGLAVVDDVGSLTFAEMEARTTAVAAGLADIGIGQTDRIAVLCCNHRGFIEATVALAKLGADTLYMNTGFAPPQSADVLVRERASGIILDQEFYDLASHLPAGWPVVLAAGGGSRRGDIPTLEGLLTIGSANAHRRPLPRRGHEARQIVLTSGTTGVPKGTRRDAPGNIDPLLAILSKIPLKAADRTLVAAPMFHSWGLAHLIFGLVLGSTLILRPRFDPEATLALIDEHRVTVLAAVPVMLQRMMELPSPVRRRYDTSSLRVVAVSGSALPGDLARVFMDEFGEVLYNLYGSTEVAWASIATPEDLRAAPGTAGRPPDRTVVRLVDDNDRAVGPGRRGRIFVGNGMMFSGYTDGSSKEILDGLMATGDTGYVDEAGRLFVEGRSDDMIVSGGENVFPAEVEDLISSHPAVVECAVIGVPDREFGQRLKAFVVCRPGFKVGADDLKAFVRDRLARYKVPRDVMFIDELPRNATGKIVRQALRQ